MIILFTSINDPSTDVIINWLNNLGANYIRINTEDLTEKINYSYEISEKETNINLSTFGKMDLSNKNSIFFRRYGTLIYPNTGSMKNIGDKLVVEKHLKEELRANRDGFYHILKDHNWIGNPDNACVNKILALKIAKEAGLKIPNTIITNNKNQLIKFCSENSECIIKCISDVETFKLEDNHFSLYTSVLSKEDLDCLPLSFFPSIFQENVKKEYEIRTFYFDGKLFSMAIFSQNDSKTSTDYRKYNNQKQNRCVPFSLPVNIELKIIDFFQRIDMKTGSIDIIKSSDGEYVFLEVNPAGQFGFVSDNCNYFIEKYIAKHLTYNENFK